MRLLTDMAGESLWRGDVIRLVHNYDLGSGSPPVDLLVYDPRDDRGIRWNDPDIGIAWPVDEPVLSAKDQVQPFLKELSERDLPS